MTNYQSGLEGEERAVDDLLAKGYNVLLRRYKTAEGEIDLIALKNNTLIFVEVKYYQRLSDAAYAITATQQQRIWNAALHFLQAYPIYNTYDLRFDAVLLDQSRTCRHIQNAWTIHETGD